MSRFLIADLRPFAAALLLTVVACGGSTEPPAPPPPPPPPPPPVVATQLGFSVPPADGRVGVVFATAPAVEIRDASGARVSSTANVTLALAGGTTGAVLRGTTTVAAVNGVATFPGLSLDSAGTNYRLIAAATGLTSATSPTFAMVRGAAVLAFRTQPVGDEAGLPLATQPIVEIRDSITGAILPDRRDTVTLAVTTNASGGTLQGTTRVAAVAGVATFSGVRISAAGSGYILTATAPGATAAASNAFTVQAITTTLRVTSGADQTGDAAVPLPSPIRLQLRRTRDSTPVAGRQLNISIVGGGALSSVQPVTNAQGEASVTWTLGLQGPQELSIQRDPEPGAVVVRATVIPRNLPLLSLTTGTSYACGIRAVGTSAVCWGRNGNGQLGDGRIDNQGRSRPQPVPGDRLFQVAAGDRTTCGIVDGGLARCWGANESGQLGNGTQTQSTSPVPVLGGQTFLSVAVGRQHACGIDRTGAALCWGRNTGGEIGDGAGGTNALNRLQPTAVTGSRVYSRITAGAEFNCALSSGTVWCWGQNGSGQLGDGTQTQRNVPVAVQIPAGERFTSISAGDFHVCATAESGRLFCWGANGNGQLGDGTTTNRSVPTAVLSTTPFVSVTAGARHSCALTGDGQAFCWGSDAEGQLGDDSQVATPGPLRRVAGTVRWATLSASAVNTCGIELTTQRTFCWGSSTFGATGDGTSVTGRVVETPVPVLGILP